MATANPIRLRKPLRIFYDVQKALFMRELNMRFSSGRAGLFWTFAEPFIQIMIFVAIKIALFGRGNSTFDFAVFLALNFTAFNLFKHIVTKSTHSFKANKALFVYKQVKPIDTIIARGLVEIFITLILVLIFIVIGYYSGRDMSVQDFNMVVFGFATLILFAYAVAIVIAVGNVFVESIGKLIGFAMTALMFGSAVFYTLDALPISARNILLINPLTHIMEIIHGSYFAALDDRYVSYDYVFGWILVLLYVGLWLYTRLEKRIISHD